MQKFNLLQTCPEVADDSLPQVNVFLMYNVFSEEEPSPNVHIFCCICLSACAFISVLTNAASPFSLALLQIAFPKKLNNQPCCMTKQYQVEF